LLVTLSSCFSSLCSRHVGEHRKKGKSKKKRSESANRGEAAQRTTHLIICRPVVSLEEHAHSVVSGTWARVAHTYAMACGRVSEAAVVNFVRLSSRPFFAFVNDATTMSQLTFRSRGESLRPANRICIRWSPERRCGTA
jgi:hypothetical protein